MTTVTLVLPCLNEEMAVGDCVTRALQTFAAAGYEGSVLVIDNGSTDRSVAEALRAGATVLHQPQPGYGAALRTGFEAATADVVVMADADGTYELEAMPKLIAPIVAGEADLVLGARLKSAKASTMPFLHRFVGTPVISFLVNRAAGGLKVSDSQSGFRAFRRSKVLELHLAGTGMEFASEMLVRAGWAKLRITEVDTTYAERIGESKLDTFPDGLRHLRQLLVLSPDMFAVTPGVIATFASLGLWAAVLATNGNSAVIGSWSWLALLCAGILSILGPLVWAGGLLLRYRAFALGIRHRDVPQTVEHLVGRLALVSGLLAITGVASVVALMVNVHAHPAFIDTKTQTVLSSYARSALTVAAFFLAAPLLSPLLQRIPMVTLPAPTRDEP